MIDNQQLASLSKLLAAAQDADQRVRILRQNLNVQEYLSAAKPINDCLVQMDGDSQVSLLSVIAIGEGEVVFQNWQSEADLAGQLKKLAGQLNQVEQFYRRIGGVVGYHNAVLELIRGSIDKKIENSCFLQPPETRIDKGFLGRESFVKRGIEGMEQLAEIYAVGGAGDRLNLMDHENGEPLPAAELRFGGITLLEWLIRDLKGREFLYERITGKPIEIPIVLMTSMEKDNDRRIREILERHRWFERSQNSFYLIIQPLVPVVTVEGHWVMSASFDLYKKPGGHGVLWKLMEDQGAFDWLREKGKEKALVRQINNPLAGEDDGLFAFTGVGLQGDKAFGFASCPRKVNASEGMNVLIKSEKESGSSSYRLTNVEYTDFKKYGIEDIPEREGSPYSLFPANTNILFVDLSEVRSRAKEYPVPGMLINLKSTALYRSPDGTARTLRAGRLESTMQNIADVIPFDAEEPEHQPVYLTYNEREKTVGSVKQAFDPNRDVEETPEFCYYKILLLHRELLANDCGVKVPKLVDKEEYLKIGPNLIFLYTPSLGPNYALIAKKIRGGEISDDSEMHIQLADVEIDNLRLEGSLSIRGESGRAFCRLKNVAVKNRGIDRQKTRDYWKNDPVRHELLEIFFEGKGEFIAEQVVFHGQQRIVIPDGVCVTASEEGSEITLKKTPLKRAAKVWKMRFDNDEKIIAEIS